MVGQGTSLQAWQGLAPAREILASICNADISILLETWTWTITPPPPLRPSCFSTLQQDSRLAGKNNMQCKDKFRNLCLTIIQVGAVGQWPAWAGGGVAGWGRGVGEVVVGRGGVGLAAVERG